MRPFARGFSSRSQETLGLLWEGNVRYRAHNSPTLAPIADQLGPSPHCKSFQDPFLGAFAKHSQKAAVGSVMSCPPAAMLQLDCLRQDFRGFFHWEFLLQFVYQIQVTLKSGKNETLCTNICLLLLIHSRCFHNSRRLCCLCGTSWGRRNSRASNIKDDRI